VTWHSLLGEPNREAAEASFLVFFIRRRAGQGGIADVAETSLLTIIAELPASVENSGDAAY
jgi:hypothetical protein